MKHLYELLKHVEENKQVYCHISHLYRSVSYEVQLKGNGLWGIRQVHSPYKGPWELTPDILSTLDNYNACIHSFHIKIVETIKTELIYYIQVDMDYKKFKKVFRLLGKQVVRETIQEAKEYRDALLAAIGKNINPGPKFKIVK